MNDKHLYPNTFQFHNDYVDKYMAFLTDVEFRVLSYMVRRVVGFFRNEGKSRISLSQMVDGLVIDGKRHDYGVGASRPAIVKACKSLEGFGLIIRVDSGSKRKAIAARWDVSFDKPELIDFDAMVARKEAKSTKEKQRTRKATTAAKASKAGVNSTSDDTNKPSKPDDTNNGAPSKPDDTNKQFNSTSDEPPPSKPDDTIPSKRDEPPYIETKYRNQEEETKGCLASASSPSSDECEKMTPQQRYFSLVCWLVGWDHKTITKDQKGQVAQTVGIFQKAGYTLEDLRMFWRDVWAKDWRWTKDGQRPSISQLRSEIGKLKSDELEADQMGEFFVPNVEKQKRPSYLNIPEL